MELIIELFLLFIIVGVALLYVTSDKPQILIKLPNEKTVYIDEKNVCYKYQKEYVKP